MCGFNSTRVTPHTMELSTHYGAKSLHTLWSLGHKHIYLIITKSDSLLLHPLFVDSYYFDCYFQYIKLNTIANNICCAYNCLYYVNHIKSYIENVILNSLFS